MDNQLSTQNILNLLYKLDKIISLEMEIIICGGAAGILNDLYFRTTMDIDILGTKPPLVQIKEAVLQIAEENNISKDWLNDGAKGFARYLPDDFQERLIVFKKKFKHLKVYLISPIDLFIMKLAAFRPEDIEDIESFIPDKSQFEIINKTILKISKFDNKKALTMKLYLEEKKYE